MGANTPGPKFTGWYNRGAGTPLDFYVNGTRVGAVSSALFAVTGVATSSTTITAGTGLTVPTGNYTVTAGDHAITAGNDRLGAVSAFATTEPTSAVVMKVGTAPVGAIATSGAVYITTGGATIDKIIADGTATQIEA